jgi:hypothetical protein
MTRFISLSPPAALMLVLAGCGADPRQEADAAPDRDGAAVAAPAKAEASPGAEWTPAEAATVSAAAPRTPETSSPAPKPKTVVPPRTMPTPEASKPADPQPDPHAGHDMDKM